MNTIESKALGYKFDHQDKHVRLDIENEDKLTGLYNIYMCLKNNDIQMYLTAGTMLGAVRNNDFIPWDWNVSTAVMAEDLIGKEKIIADELSNNFKLTVTIGGKCVNYNDPSFNEFISKPYKHIRYNLYYGNQYFQIENLILSPDKKWRTRPQCKAPSEFFNGVKMAKIRGYDFPVSNKAETCLEWYYGADWKTPIQKDSRAKSISNNSLITRVDRLAGL